jgi:hypothetical protein
MQNELPTHEQSFLQLEVSQLDHYGGRYIWLKSKCPLNAPLGRKGLTLSRLTMRLLCVLKHETIQQPNAHADYVQSMNDIDWNDQDRPYKRHYPSSAKASKSNCGVQMWNASKDRQVYQRAGESWAGIRNILLNVLHKTADY